MNRRDKRNSTFAQAPGSDSDNNDELAQRNSKTPLVSIQNLLDEEKERFDLPHDSWGAGIVVIVKDLADIIACNAHTFQVLRCLFCLGCLVMNLYMQIQMLSWVWTFVIGVS